MKSNTLQTAAGLVLVLFFAACSGSDGANGRQGASGEAGPQGIPGLSGDAGPQGPAGDAGPAGEAGPAGDAGPAGEAGPPGTPGTPGTPGGNVQVENFHGSAALEAADLAAGKYMVDATISGATADAAGKVSVDFKVLDKDGKAVTGIKSVYANIAKLVPKQNGESYNNWVPYIYRKVTVAGTGDWPAADGTSADQGYRENNGTLTDHGDGTYTYEFATNIASVTTPAAGKAVSYDRSLTHRVLIMMGGHSGPTADATFDFVPDGSALTETRDIVETATCQQCHGDGFHGHGGDRLTVKDCVTCHNASGTDPYGGQTLDFKVMIHKIHAGGELASIPGADGKVYDDPATAQDESADNGEYAIWNYQHAKTEWSDVEFPAVLDNCTKCHQGGGAQVDDWKTTPSRAACGACHDTVDFATGTNHPGGQMLDDLTCTTCHKATGNSFGKAVTNAHDFTANDERNIPEFTPTLTMSAPANGKYYVAGEAPVVTLVLTDNENGGATLDHTTVVQDSAAEGCAAGAACPARDGKFTSAALFVSGPRARRMPVLTTAARAQVLSSSAGPFDISAATTLDLVVDNGKDIYLPSLGSPLASAISVKVSDGTFADATQATSQEIANWLNANAAFKARAIAFIDGGKVGIRSRNLGDVFALQLSASDVTTAVFGGDTTVHNLASFTPANQLYAYTDSTKNDPKATRTAGNITYQLDPVDDLASGTYVVDVEMADRGRKSDTDYKTPSVARITFQVGTDKEEAAPATGCDSCHTNAAGQGFVVDAPRHNKLLDHTAVDQCGSCHDYQPQGVTGDWSGAKAISRRVHAVHNGANLTYPLVTVGHSDGVPGRNWAIAMPQDVRTCDKTCHGADTSGTWMTKASRQPCYGCHDTDAAQSHMKLMTYDPTPANPFSGDEEESCTVCH